MVLEREWFYPQQCFGGRGKHRKEKAKSQSWSSCALPFPPETPKAGCVGCRSRGQGRPLSILGLHSGPGQSAAGHCDHPARPPRQAPVSSPCNTLPLTLPLGFPRTACLQNWPGRTHIGLEGSERALTPRLVCRPGLCSQGLGNGHPLPALGPAACPRGRCYFCQRGE